MYTYYPLQPLFVKQEAQAKRFIHASQLCKKPPFFNILWDAPLDISENVSLLQWFKGFHRGLQPLGFSRRRALRARTTRRTSIVIQSRPPGPDAVTAGPQPASREGLAARYDRVRRRSQALASPLSAEDQTIQSMADASPTKWHLAHTTWFFETMILSAFEAGYTAFDPAYRYLFNSYYESLGARHPRPQRGLLTRPSCDEITRYRAHVDALMPAFIAGCDGETWARAAGLIELGCHHEEQHQELVLMDILHAFSCNPTSPAYHAPTPHAVKAAPSLQWTAFPGGDYEIGHDGDGFAFDNESPRHTIKLHPYRIANRLITNGEWLSFMSDNGYRRPELWLSDGWDWVCSNEVKAPATTAPGKCSH